MCFTSWKIYISSRCVVLPSKNNMFSTTWTAHNKTQLIRYGKYCARSWFCDSGEDWSWFSAQRELMTKTCFPLLRGSAFPINKKAFKIYLWLNLYSVFPPKSVFCNDISLRTEAVRTQTTRTTQRSLICSAWRSRAWSLDKSPALLYITELYKILITRCQSFWNWVENRYKKKSAWMFGCKMYRIFRHCAELRTCISESTDMKHTKIYDFFSFPKLHNYIQTQTHSVFQILHFYLNSF